MSTTSTRRFAYTAICTVNGYIIALTEEDVAGWTPVVTESPYTDVEEADMRAQECNRTLQLSSADVWAIVASSMEASLRQPHGTWTLR